MNWYTRVADALTRDDGYTPVRSVAMLIVGLFTIAVVGLAACLVLAA